MICTQTEVIDIPASLATILTIRESGIAMRTLSLENLSASELAISLEESADGGANWSLLEPAFTLGVKGSATGVLVKYTDSTNILRVRASGGGDDRDLALTYMRAVEDTSGTGRTWTRPSL